MSKIILEECPNCGSANQKDKSYCDYCGSLLEAVQEETAVNEKDASPGEQVKTDYNTEEKIQNSPVYPKPSDIQPAPEKNAGHPKTTSGLAIASFVLAFFPIFWLIALILGIIANVSISRPDSNTTGRGFSTAAIIMSSLGILSGIIVLIIIIASGITMGAIGSSY